MDRLRYRVWCNDERGDDTDMPDKGWLEPQVEWFQLGPCGSEIQWGTDYDANEPLPVGNRFVVEQCTGLPDRNGRLIYEGDLLEFQDDYGEDGRIVKVVWCGEDNYPAFDVFPNVFPETNGLSHMLGTGVVTVIGDIHNDGHLLEAEKSDS